MASNVQKTPFARLLNEFALRKVAGAIEQLGRSLPASVVSRDGAIVTVRFELQNTPYTIPNVRVPMIGSEYIRLPIQPGCLGWVMSADAYLGGMSGLGGGVASLVPRGNLSMLVWSPIGNKNWTPSDDDNKAVIYGPDGVILRNGDSTSKIDIADTSLTIEFGAFSIVLNASGITFNGPLTFSNNTVNVTGGTLNFGGAAIAGVGALTSTTLTVGGKNLGPAHTHSGVTTGGGNSGPVV